MASNQEQRALYGCGVVIMALPESIGMERFVAVESDFKSRLDSRSGMPNSISTLIAGMFERRVITCCEITYGTKATFTLSARDADGHILARDGKRQRFEEAYTDITGRPIKITYQSDGPVRSTGGRGGRGSSHGDGFWSAVGDAIGEVVGSLFSGD